MSDVLIACVYTPCFLIYLALIAQGIRQLRAGAITLPFWARLLVTRSHITSNTPALVYTVAQISSRATVLIGIVLSIVQSNIWLLVGAGFISAIVQVAALGYLYSIFRDDVRFDTGRGDVVQGEVVEDDESDKTYLPPGE